MFYTVLYDSMLHYTSIKKITHDHLWFHRFVHTSLDSIVNLSVNWQIDSLFVEFWPKIDLGKV